MLIGSNDIFSSLMNNNLIKKKEVSSKNPAQQYKDSQKRNKMGDGRLIKGGL